MPRHLGLRLALVLLSVVPSLAGAQVDSALVGRILQAEERRDSLDAALAEGAASQEPRIQALAIRALERIRDPLFARRDSIPGAAVEASPTWPEPEWRLRFRALTARRDDCTLMAEALRDPSWPVRLRAAALVRNSCASDSVLIETFMAWAGSMPAAASRRAKDGVSWHGGSFGLVALARIQPRHAHLYISSHARHPQWNVRQYAARAATVALDTATLRRLARDPDDNVKEVAIEGLARVGGRAEDLRIVQALRSEGAQAVRAAAIALKGSTVPEVPAAARAALARFNARANASERDARVALLDLLGRPATDDVGPPANFALPPDAVALALGEARYLRVTMADSTGGGGSFVVRLRGDVAPLMAARILGLARQGYYDGQTWHRVEHDFVIQGAGPGANEYVGYRQFLVDELGTLPHRRGTVGMSTRGHDTGDAQWFVNLRDNLRLGRDYTVFAEVVEGIEVVDGVMEGDVIQAITPVRPPRGA